jgi:hypothetical protein
VTEVLDLIGEELQRAARARSERHAHPASRHLRRRATLSSSRRSLLGLASALAAAVIGLLIATGGSKTTVAQAFPIFAANTPVFGVTPVHEHGSIGMIAAIARSARTRTHSHPFPPPYTGWAYVAESADGRTLGLYYVTAGTALGQRYVGFSGRTVSTSEAEHHGAFYSTSAHGTSDLFIALVPTGATLDSTYRGTTKRLAIRDGIATGVLPGETVLAIHVDSSTLIHHLRPYGR